MPKGPSHHDYHFLAVAAESSPNGDISNPNELFYCAYPATYDWRHRRTFIRIRGEYNAVFSIDNGGKPITKWPSDEELSKRFTEVGFMALLKQLGLNISDD